MKYVCMFAFALASPTLLAAEQSSDDKTYMDASMTRLTLSYCTLVGKKEGKEADRLYRAWIEPRAEAITRVGAKGCNQLCRMAGDPLQPLSKPVVMASGPLAMSPQETASMCDKGMAHLARQAPARAEAPVTP